MKKFYKIGLNIFYIFIIISCSPNKFEYAQTRGGIEFSLNGITKKIIFYEDNIVRVQTTKDGESFKDSSLAVIASAKSADFEIKDDSNQLTIIGNSLTIKIDKKNGYLVFLDSMQQKYLSEHPSVFSELKDTSLFNKKYYRIFQPFKLNPEEAIYGLGQFQNGYMNYRDKNLVLVHANKTAIVPLLVSTKNYGILWDNYSHSEFHDSTDYTSFSSQVANQIDYYFIAGENIDEVISGYRTLTGKAPMFPKKAYGYWQSKERYKSFNELHEVVKKYRENNIPIDNIVQDWRYWGRK